MNEEFKRPYVYEIDWAFIMRWGEINKIHTPNGRPNFPAYLKAFIDKHQRKDKLYI